MRRLAAALIGLAAGAWALREYARRMDAIDAADWEPSAEIPPARPPTCECPGGPVEWVEQGIPRIEHIGACPLWRPV